MNSDSLFVVTFSMQNKPAVTPSVGMDHLITEKHNELKQVNNKIRSYIAQRPVLTTGQALNTPRPKWAPSVTAFLVCNAVKATVVVFTDPPGDTTQRPICFFGADAKR